MVVIINSCHNFTHHLFHKHQLWNACCKYLWGYWCYQDMNRQQYFDHVTFLICHNPASFIRMESSQLNLNLIKYSNQFSSQKLHDILCLWSNFLFIVIKQIWIWLDIFFLFWGNELVIFAMCMNYISFSGIKLMFVKSIKFFNWFTCASFSNITYQAQFSYFTTHPEKSDLCWNIIFSCPFMIDIESISPHNVSGCVLLDCIVILSSLYWCNWHWRNSKVQ